MEAPGPKPVLSGRPGAMGAILGATLFVFSLTTALPWYAAFAVAGSGTVAAIVLRARSLGVRTDASALIVLMAIGVLGAGAPATPLAGGAGGAAVLAFLAWLADQPGRVEGTVGQAWATIGLVALAFVITWSCAFLVPRLSTPIGIAGGLIVIVLFLAALLLARPGLVQREPPLNAAWGGGGETQGPNTRKGVSSLSGESDPGDSGGTGLTTP